MKRLFWQIFYVLGGLSILLFMGTVVGLLILMMATDQLPEETLKSFKAFCEKKIPRKYQIITRDDMYKVQSKCLFRWETHPNYLQNRQHYNTLEDAKAAYTSIKKEHGYHSNDWSRVKLPCETKLWKELNE